MVPESAFLPEAALPDSAEPPLEPEQPARPKPATASADMPAMPMKLRRLMYEPCIVRVLPSDVFSCKTSLQVRMVRAPSARARLQARSMTEA